MSNKLCLQINPIQYKLLIISGKVDNYVLKSFNEVSPGIATQENLELLGTPIFKEGFTPYFCLPR